MESYLAQAEHLDLSLVLRFVNFQDLDPKFHLVLEPKVLKLEGLSFGNMVSIFVLKGRIVILKRRKGQGQTSQKFVHTLNSMNNQ